MKGLDDSPAVRAAREALARRARVDRRRHGAGRAARPGDPRRRPGDRRRRPCRGRSDPPPDGRPDLPAVDTFRSYRALAPDRDWTVDITPLQGDTIEDDLANRDFAINAIAVPLAAASRSTRPAAWRDVEGACCACCPAPTSATRCARCGSSRLATELDLAPDPATEAGDRAAAAARHRGRAERVFAELRRLVLADRVLDGLDLADELGIVRAVIPELDELHGVEQSHFHHADVHGHTLEVLQELLGLERDLERVFGDELAPARRAVLDEPLADELTRGQALRFAALLHDIGKPQTRGVRPDGRVTFIGHDAVGEDVIGDISRACARAPRCATSWARSRATTWRSASWSTSGRCRARPSTAT